MSVPKDACTSRSLNAWQFPPNGKIAMIPQHPTIYFHTCLASIRCKFTAQIAQNIKHGEKTFCRGICFGLLRLAEKCAYSNQKKQTIQNSKINKHNTTSVKRERNNSYQECWKIGYRLLWLGTQKNESHGEIWKWTKLVVATISFGSCKLWTAKQATNLFPP